MSKVIRVFKILTLVLLFLLFSNENVFSQDPILDTVYVTAEKHKTLEEQIIEKARIDIANGEVILFSYGWPVLNIDEVELKKLATKYGFEFEKRGCVRSAIDRIYEDEVMLYLNLRNGKGWWDKFQEEAEKLITYPSLPQQK